MMTLATLSISHNKKAKIRRETVGGREFLVAPANAIVPGVLSGSNGPILYTAEENEKNPDAWNGMPITVYHPVRNGVPISARDPDVLSTQTVGQVLRTKTDKGTLKTEAWFDVERTKAVDVRVHNALEAGEPIELSTGLYLEYEPAPEGATHNGVPYSFIARNYRPDHLAVLPDEEGACSLKDGCGILVNTLSHGDVRDQLEKALAALYTQAQPHCWLSEVYDTYAIYYHDGELYKVSYEKGKDEVRLTNSPVKVVRQTMYVAANQSTTDALNTPTETPTTPTTINTNEGDDVKLSDQDRKGIVTLLATNCACWKGKETVLTQLDDASLTQFKNLFEQTQTQNSALATVRASLGLGENATAEEIVEALSRTTRGTTPLPSGSSSIQVSPQVPATNSQPPTITKEQWWQMAPPEARTAIERAMVSEQRERTNLIGTLTANMAEGPAKQAAINRFHSMTTDVLSDLASAVPPPPPSHRPFPTFNYQGAAGSPPDQAVTTNKNDEQDILYIPTSAPDWMTKRKA